MHGLSFVHHPDKFKAAPLTIFGNQVRLAAKFVPCRSSVAERARVAQNPTADGLIDVLT